MVFFNFTVPTVPTQKPRVPTTVPNSPYTKSNILPSLQSFGPSLCIRLPLAAFVERHVEVKCLGPATNHHLPTQCLELPKLLSEILNSSHCDTASSSRRASVLAACGVLVCCRDRTNGARGAPNRSVMRDLERSWPGCFQFLITKSVPAATHPPI